jgi:hypothetical protein
MPETVLERHYRDRLRSVQQITLHDAGQTTLAGPDVEDLVTLCAELSASGRQLLEREFKLIFKVPDLTVAWLRERRQAIEELAAKYLELVATLKGLVGSASGSTAGHEQLCRLDQEVQRFVDAKEKVLMRWPVGGPEEVVGAWNDEPPEDYLDVDEAFAQIAGVDLATWRRRIEKRTRQA